MGVIWAHGGIMLESFESIWGSPGDQLGSCRGHLGRLGANQGFTPTRGCLMFLLTPSKVTIHSEAPEGEQKECKESAGRVQGKCKEAVAAFCPRVF